MKRTTRMLSLVLALLMLLPLLASCKDEGEKGKGTKNETEDTVYEGENGYVLAVNDYGGETFTICTAGYTDINTIEENGESLNDAVFRRNAKVESLYNIDLSFQECDRDPTAFYTTTIASGDDSYQIMSGRMGSMAVHTMTANMYQDLLALPYFDFSQAWWSEKYVESAALGNRLYMALGNLDSTCYQLYCAVFFNKSLAEDYRVDDLYALTKDGKWTIDKMIEYAKRAAADVDGDGIMNRDIDQFGLTVSGSYTTDAFVSAFDIQLSDYGADGLPEILPPSERLLEAEDKLRTFFKGNWVDFLTDISFDTVFPEGRALFECGRMHGAMEYRAMENDFGILPYPKWDEGQDGYYSYSALGETSVYAIPSTANGERAANIMEALSYFGYQTVLPTFYDKTLKGKTVRDPQSSEMLDIIYSNPSYDFSRVYGSLFEIAPGSLLGRSLKLDKKLSTMYYQNRRIYEATMKSLIEKLDIEEQ